MARAAVLTDTEQKPLPAPTPLPGYLAPFIDPVFGSKITRITGLVGDPIPGIERMRWPEVARHGYSKRPAWNADGSLLLLEHCRGLMLDGHSYRPLFIPEIPGECRWHPTQPDKMIFVQDNAVGTFDVRRGTSEIVAVKLDGSLTVERLAHLHTNKTDYVTEAHGVPSPDGRKALWASNWDAPTGRPINAFVLEV